MNIKIRVLLVLLLAVMPTVHVRSELVLPELLSDNMVLKQKSKISLWGWDTPGTVVVVNTGWNGKSHKTVTDKDGRWAMRVSTSGAGGPYEIVVEGTSRKVLHNVMLGEVWFTSGQSNMGWTLAEEKNSTHELGRVKNNMIRLFQVPRRVYDKSVSRFGKQISWAMCDSVSAKNFSAMSCYFAEVLQKELGVPVGIISASWAGTSIESWLPYDLQESDANLINPIHRWQSWEASFPADSARYAEALRAEARGELSSPVKKPKSVHMNERPHCRPGSLYDSMIYPCQPYTISGVIWYQGENSVEWANEYAYQLKKLIDSWRQGFGARFPFLVGQLTNFNYPSAKLAAIVRDAQLQAADYKDTYVICTIDIGNAQDVHPNDKRPFGKRFADMALNKVYGYTSRAADYPIARQARMKDNRIVVEFDHADGLHIEGNNLNDIVLYDAQGERLRVDKTYVDHEKLVLESDNAVRAKQVTYAVDNDVQANLYNGEQLPAFPFELEIRH